MGCLWATVNSGWSSLGERIISYHIIATSMGWVRLFARLSANEVPEHAMTCHIPCHAMAPPQESVVAVEIAFWIAFNCDLAVVLSGC
jgi:hypothetical protein